MLEPLDVPPEVVAEVEDALEDYAAEWLWEAERLFDAWEEDGEGHLVLMPVRERDGDGTPMEEGSQWMGEDQ